MIRAALLAVVMASTAPQGAVITLGTLVPGVSDLEARVAGQPGRFLFDSGGGQSLVTPEFARRIGCTPWGKVTGFRGTGERIDMQRCPAAPIAVGGGVAVTHDLAVFDIMRLLGPHAPSVAGLIALDVFDGRTVTLSVARREIRVETPASLAAVVRSAIPIPVRLVRDAQGAALTVDAGVPTSKGLLWMEIDTGNAGPSLVDKRAAALVGLDPDKAGLQTLDAPLAGGARLSGPVQVGDFIFDGNLGRAFLARWDVTLDLEHGRGWLTPARGVASTSPPVGL